MSVFPVKLPDVGEGVAEAELIEWYVEVGDQVTPDTVLADVMTDKATVEISSPVTGVVTFRIGEPGEVLAVGTEFVGTSISSGGDGVDKSRNHGATLIENPCVKFHNTERGYVRCTVKPGQWQSDYQTVEYISRPGAPLITRGSFVAEAGQPGIKPA